MGKGKQKNRKAPLSGGTEQQRKVITQDQYIAALLTLQGWGYNKYDIANFNAAIRFAGGRI